MPDKERAMRLFVSNTSTTYKRLGPMDADYRMYGLSKETVGYAEVRHTGRTIANSYPLKVPAKKVVKVCDKILNPVVIWECLDGIIYGDPTELVGEVSLVGRELTIKYDKQKKLRYKKEY